MTMKQIFFLLLFYSGLQLSAQKTIYGYIQDSANGERLIGAYVKPIGEAASTSTNNYGYFSLQSNKDTTLLFISYVGFAEKLITIYPSTEFPLNINLASNFQFKGVKITGK